MTKRQRNDGLRKLCECSRRTWAKCPHPWHFNFKWAGELYRFSLERRVGGIAKDAAGHWKRDRATLGDRITSKTDAESERDRLKAPIRAGALGQPTARRDMTLRELADTYLDRYVKRARAATERAFTWAFNTICRTEIPRPGGASLQFGAWRLDDIVTDTIERFREVRLAAGTAGPIGVKRNLEHLRALYNWGVRLGYVEQSPFTRHAVAVVKLPRKSERSRRLNPDTEEEAAVLAACGPHLRAVVQCALETGMRRGEILSLQWSQITGATVDGDQVTWAPRAEIVLPWEKTKTRRERRIPISKTLRAILDMRRHDPDGEPLPPEAYVFGDETGGQVKDIKRAWMTAVLKAHGYAPTFTETANLSPASRAAFAGIDLHFHDLRREAGSRWLEGGVGLHTVRDWLGHTSIEQTSTYLAGTIRTQHDAMAAFEAHRERLQRIATRSRKGVRKGKRTAKVGHNKTNKNTVRRETAIM